MTLRSKLVCLPFIMGSLAMACSGSGDHDNPATGGSAGDGDGDGPSGGKVGNGDGDGDESSGGTPGDGDGDGDGDGGLGGFGGLGGQQGSGGSAADNELAQACEARCATTVTLDCPENTDQAACELDCASGATPGCEAEWTALKVCEATLSSDGFQCLSFYNYNFVDLSLSGYDACEQEAEANNTCVD